MATASEVKQQNLAKAVWSAGQHQGPRAMRFGDRRGGDASMESYAAVSVLGLAAQLSYFQTFCRPCFPPSFHFCEQSQVFLVNSFCTTLASIGFCCLQSRMLQETNWYFASRLVAPDELLFLFINSIQDETKQEHFLLFMVLEEQFVMHAKYKALDRIIIFRLGQTVYCRLMYLTT